MVDIKQFCFHENFEKYLIIFQFELQIFVTFGRIE